MKTPILALALVATLTAPAAAMSISLPSLLPRVDFPQPTAPDATRDQTQPQVLGN
ncbi:MAG: hypothetical protein AAF919_09620 [Pseudomonadota bacterium]